jgi:cell fate regulator YaaT (PSP1 superfamily)
MDTPAAPTPTTPPPAGAPVLARVRLRDHGPLECFHCAPGLAAPGDWCVVNFDRGQDVGKLLVLGVDTDADVPERQSIVRVCSANDLQRIALNRREARQQITPCREEVSLHKLGMKIIDAEYTFDRSKIIFYFAADERVDFRALVRDLARRLRIRIELRQIGVRDETKLLGAIACCGRVCCCNSWMNEFEPVNIRMAKLQQLQLHPAKLSGVCNRLKCCLGYECVAYRALQDSLPLPGQRVRTPAGTGDVIGVALLTRQVTVRHDDDAVQTFSGDDVTVVSRSKARAKTRARKRRQQRPGPRDASRPQPFDRADKAAASDEGDLHDRSALTPDELQLDSLR